MAQPYNDLLFSHKREEEALNVLLWNKPQGILLSKHSKLKMASRICYHTWRNKIIYCMHIYLNAPPRKTHRQQFFPERNGWDKVRMETSLSLYVLHALNLIICVYITYSKYYIHTHTHICMDTHIHIQIQIHNPHKSISSTKRLAKASSWPSLATSGLAREGT